MQTNDIRCGQCRRKLGEGTYRVLAIKCPRCGTLNHFEGIDPTPARQRASTDPKDARDLFNNPTPPG